MALKDYIQVNERIVSATPPSLAPIHSVEVTAPIMLTETMGYMCAIVTLEDDRSAEGTASFDLSLTGKSAQATNPIEDCETSAVGRALAFLGYHSDRSIASREEVQEARALKSLNKGQTVTCAIAGYHDGKPYFDLVKMPAGARTNGTPPANGHAQPPAENVLMGEAVVLAGCYAAIKDETERKGIQLYEDTLSEMAMTLYIQIRD